MRRQRRTLRSRKYRRKWFATELERLGLLRPQNPLHDPVTLRFRALNGESLAPEELHSALTHLFKRRGYTEVPWANKPANEKENDPGKKEGLVKESVLEIQKKMAEANCQFPCQFLMKSREQAGKNPTEKWGRKIYWPRELLKNEFRAILTAQAGRFPKLAEKSDWLLYGDSQTKNSDGRIYHVFFKNTEARNPGVLGLRWPRFDNRGPALDTLQPVDEQGRPMHVVRKNKKSFINAQWELALMNFRVTERATGKLVVPDSKSLVRLREIWETRKRGKKEIAVTPEDPKSIKISERILKKWVKEFNEQYTLIENQPPLTPQTSAGRARYSSPTLNRIAGGERFDPPQPILRRQGENTEQALNRYLADIKHPLVRHRLILFRRLLAQLISRHGKPDMLILEAVRSLALGPKAKNEMNKRNEEFRKQREIARADLAANRESASRQAILRYRLWYEAKGRCPLCLETIARTDLGHGADIAHLVPRSRVDCNEMYNLTVTHIKCNRDIQGDRTPYAAFSHTEIWENIKTNAELCFSKIRVNKDHTKAELFISPNAEELIEQKADLQHTAYIARVIRHVSLIQLGWLSEDGHDPTMEQGNKPSSCFQVTNGSLTSRLRQAWGLNRILHPLPAGKRWEDLTEEEQRVFQEKNRGDLRHHALDAMVIACTLPWLAHRTHGATDELGNHGWWTQDEKRRSKAANHLFPLGGQMYEVCKGWIDKVVVRQHASRSNHRKAYNTTLYSKKADNTYVARKPFTSLTPKNLHSIWPKEFAAYCDAAWKRYVTESSGIDGELKKTRGCLPDAFTRKLCFSHFQKWHAVGAQELAWPQQVKIPIRSVKLISVKDDTAVTPFSSGTHAFVERHGFKEVRIHIAEDGKSFVPVFIPYWKGDRPLCEKPIKAGSSPVAVIRLGQPVEIKYSPGQNAPKGKYRVASTMQANIKLLPVYLADNKEALKAAGYLENGVNIGWNSFIKAVGYELPHCSSDQAESAGAAPA
ncbi:MAG: hypothetical protein L6455_14525 [Kiritimatiellae bacterium]|nr:hypothetical protein [Kiritimatiellia bacterium]